MVHGARHTISCGLPLLEQAASCILALESSSFAARSRARAVPLEAALPIATKDIGTIAAKWSSRAQAAGPDYTAGVKSTQKDWAALTAAAADSWGAGVSQAVSDGRFAKGVTAAGSPKWQAAASTKGAQRYPQGVAAGQSSFSTGFGPFLSTIQNLTLPPRSPRGSPNNIQRVSTIDAALHAKKIGG